jgi:DNA-binding NtrC family response regulator
MVSEKTLEASANSTRSGSGSLEPHLFLVIECQRPLDGGARYGLRDVREVRIGRGTRREVSRNAAEKALEVRVPDGRISASHARLFRDADALHAEAGVPLDLRASGWTLEDVGSTNGTRVNGHRVTSTRLQDGDVIEVGTTFFRFRADMPTPRTSAVDVDSGRLPGRAQGFATLVPAYADALAMLLRVAPSPVPVLLLGESGTGKELLANAVHTTSGRRGAFVPVNCGALPDTLVESQLFGHVRGAFSGALRDEPGFVRASDGGTLFLDEIGDLPRASQASLLRVLQEREVTPVGATRPVKVDMRVVAATHLRVDALHAGDRFRHDLYARLAGYTHELLPLRERREDIGMLVGEILRNVVREGAESVRLSGDVGRLLLAYDFPLNVRELHQALAVAVVIAGAEPLAVAHFPEPLRRAGAATSRPSTPPSAASSGRGGAPQSADDPVRDALVAALQTHRGNVSEVARTLGKTRMQVHRWMRRYGIDPASFRG